MALSKGRNTKRRMSAIRTVPMKGATTIYGGGIVVVGSDGFARPARVATTDKALGRARKTVVNTGADGAETIDVETGCFAYANSSAGDLIARTDIGATAYLVDDETVAKTNGSNTRSAAGPIFDVDADGVWIDFR